MTRALTALPLAFALAFAVPAFAQEVPPDDVLALSEIVLMLEESQPVRVFVEVEWDDDGYWEVSYVDNDNRRIEIRVDPMTATIMPR
jgi:hypothetical protein